MKFGLILQLALFSVASWAACPVVGGEPAPCAAFAGTDIANQGLAPVASALLPYEMESLRRVLIPRQATDVTQTCQCQPERYRALAGLNADAAPMRQTQQETRQAAVRAFITNGLADSFRRYGVATEGLRLSRGNIARGCTFSRMEQADTECSSKPFYATVIGGLRALNFPEGDSLGSFANQAVARVSSRIGLAYPCSNSPRDTREWSYSNFRDSLAGSAPIPGATVDAAALVRVRENCGQDNQGAGYRDCAIFTLTKYKFLHTASAADQARLANLSYDAPEFRKDPAVKGIYDGIATWAYHPLNQVFTGSPEGLEAYARIAPSARTNRAFMEDEGTRALAERQFQTACLELESDLVKAACFGDDLKVGTLHPARFSETLKTMFEATDLSDAGRATLVGLACEVAGDRPVGNEPVVSFSSTSEIVDALATVGIRFSRWMERESSNARPDITFPNTFESVQCTPILASPASVAVNVDEDYSAVPDRVIVVDPPTPAPALTDLQTLPSVVIDPEPVDVPETAVADASPDNTTAPGPEAQAPAETASLPAVTDNTATMPLAPAPGVAAVASTPVVSVPASATSEVPAATAAPVSPRVRQLLEERTRLEAETSRLEDRLEEGDRVPSEAEAGMLEQLRAQGEQLRVQAEQIQRLQAERDQLRRPVSRAPASAAPVVAPDMAPLAPAVMAAASAAASPATFTGAAANAADIRSASTSARAVGDRRQSGGPSLISFRSVPPARTGDAVGSEEVTDEDANNYVESTLETLSANPDQLYARVSLVTHEASGEQMVRIEGDRPGEATTIPLTSLRPEIAQRLTSVWERKLSAATSRLSSQTVSYGELLTRLNASLGRQ